MVVAAFMVLWAWGARGPSRVGQVTPTMPEGLCPLAEPGCESDDQSAVNVATHPTYIDEAGQARVRAVLFWMEGCPRCDEVVRGVLPPLYERYGDALYVHMEEVVGLEEVERLFGVGQRLGLRKEEIGVPILLIGDQTLAGADEIGKRLPRLVERGMKGTGIDFPEVPEFGIAPVADAAEMAGEGFDRWLLISAVAVGLLLLIIGAHVIRLKKASGTGYL